MTAEWPLTALGDLAADEEGAIAIGPFGSSMTADCYTSAGVPVIRGGNLTGGRTFTGDFKYVSTETAARLARSTAKARDLVFPHRGAIGEVGLVPEGQVDKWMLSTSLMKLTCDPEKASAEFVYYCFRSERGRRELLKHASTVGTPGIGQPLTSLRACRIPAPPILEQQRIAAVLGALDDKIELNRKMNETLEQMAQAIFKSWFIDFDGHTAFQDSPLGPIPKGWRATTLGIICKELGGDIQTGPFGSQLHASDYVDDGVPSVMPKDLKEDRISTANIARVREGDAQRLARHRLEVGDIVYSRRGDVERCALVTETEKGWLCGTGCLRVRPGANGKPVWLFRAVTTEHARAWLVRHAHGATMPNLNTTILGQLPLVDATPALQQKYCETVAPLLERRNQNWTENDTLAELRDTLLPKLISGEIRIKVAEKTVGEAT